VRFLYENINTNNKSVLKMTIVFTNTTGNQRKHVYAGLWNLRTKELASIGDASAEEIERTTIAHPAEPAQCSGADERVAIVADLLGDLLDEELHVVAIALLTESLQCRPCRYLEKNVRN
jgi:hypothetical protein